MVGLDFSNKNVVITGGNGGIGTPVVRGVLEGGGNVILTARRNIDDFTSALNEEFGEGRVKSGYGRTGIYSRRLCEDH